MRVLMLCVALLCAPAALAADYKPAKGPDGKSPDLNGIWQTMNEANWDLELHLARPSLQVREGPHGPVPAKVTLAMGAVGAVPPGMGVVEGGAIPYKPEALAVKQENQANWAERDPEVKCYLPGVPRATYMPQPFQIFQSKDAVFIAYQYAGAVREIYMKDPGPPQVDTWMGQSVGHWEGNTLVVVANGFNGQAWLDRAGNFTSSQLTVTERYTPTSPNHMLYEATIEDPETFTRPWKISMPLYRRMEPNAQLMDFKCVEFVEELLYGEYRRNPLD
ncbi:MAG: hypothetical protein KDI31_13455 [Pseudomonadales bacterium]|nr:hypothetical protein [Pseudomonadales bacterium]